MPQWVLTANQSCIRKTKRNANQSAFNQVSALSLFLWEIAPCVERACGPILWIPLRCHLEIHKIKLFNDSNISMRPLCSPERTFFLEIKQDAWYDEYLCTSRIRLISKYGWISDRLISNRVRFNSVTLFGIFLRFQVIWFVVNYKNMSLSARITSDYCWE